MSEQQKPKKRFSLRKLIYNDKNLIIISLLAAVCIWVATSMNLSPETTKNISVPLKIDFSDTVTEELGFKCYGESSMTVNVTVRAKKYLAKDISADDLDVKLQTSSVTTTGIHEVPISVSAGDSGDFTVESYYPTVYTGYFDVPEEQEMEIKPEKFRWYAAYHDEGHHPHVHMMAWSADPQKGHLTPQGIAAMRSKMTNEIFRNEMTQLYIQKDAAYKESIQTAKEALLLYIQMLESSASADLVIEQQLRDLSHALESVGGKHVYSYLPKSVKAQVDAIVERLAQLPEVAACYDQWWQLKDEIAGYYGRNTPPRQPLTQRKEFRSLKNWIIREAEDISFSPSADSVEPGEKQSTEKTSPIRGSVDVQPVGETVSARHIPANVVMRLLHHMGQIFRTSMPVIPPALRIDSKRRRRLQEKRMALGHKRDDHEDEQLPHVNDNTM